MQGKKSMIGSIHENHYNSNNPISAGVNYINCYEGYMPTHSIKSRPYDTSGMQGVINRNKHKGSAYCMKIMGLATYIA